MQGDATVSGNFCKQLLLSVPVLLVLSAFDVYAQQGVLSFHGQVVNPTCEVDAAHAARLVEQARLVPIRPGPEVKVSRVSNACQAQGVPVSTHFEPLVDADSQRISESSGVLTVTYQ